MAGHRIDRFGVGHAEIIPNPYNKIAGFSVRSGEGGVFFVPGFPVMAWPMIEWVLDHHFAHLHVGQGDARALGDRLRRDGGDADAADGGDRVGAIAGIKVFSLPSVDHPEWGRHIELGVKGDRRFARRRLSASCSKASKRNRPGLAPNWCDSVATTLRRGAIACTTSSAPTPAAVTGTLSAKFRARFWGPGAGPC